jgi:poly(ribitol-phosphate) beta-N-acetylglucosaminyltransferase
VRVSVVVPVYNPGRYILDLIESLRAQTLDPSEFEAILVDDGSTDDTPALLDRVAAETPNIRVIHTPNSGWPGRPRNIGLDAAQGDYVFLSDHDDRLDPAALERLADFADAHGSDVVIGRIVGVGRNAPDRIFARTLVDAQTDPGLLMTSLTPQKLYRRAFLDERGIRFPEGKRRLEDHLFVTTAYLRAERVSVYADHPVYYFVLRDDAGNASRRRIEWAGYFANAGESVEVVDAEAPDERTRIVMRARWLRTEALGRLHGRRFADHPDRDELLAAARGFVQRHYPVAEIDRLGPADRLIGRLLLDGRDADVVAFARWEASVGLVVQVDAARIDAATRTLEARLRAEPRADLPLPAELDALPSGYPTRAELERAVAVPRGARLSARLRTAEGDLAEADVQQRRTDDGLTAVATYDLGRRPALAERRWRLRVTVRGAGPARTEAPLVPRAARAAVDTAAVRLGDRRYSLAVGTQRRLVLRVEHAGLVPGARRIARRGLRLARRVARAVRRRRARG